MIRDDGVKSELQQYLRQNRAAQTEIAHQLKAMAAHEDDALKLLSADSRKLEAMFPGWTGEAADQHRLKVQEENEAFRRSYLNRFAQEHDRLDAVQKRLRIEEQKISDTMRKRSDEETR